MTMRQFIFPILIFIGFSKIFAFKDSNQSLVLSNDYRINGVAIQNAFGETKNIALKTTVRLLRNDKLIALGGIVSEDGYVLTKASSCVGARWAETYEGMKYSLKIKKRDEESDFALYKIVSEEKKFPFIDWELESNATEGNWVVSAHSSLKEIRTGIKSGNNRKIGREGGVMGVMLTNDKSDLQGVKVSEVIPYAAAFRAGLKVGDIITHADKRRVKSQDSLIKIVGKKDPGDVVSLSLNRNGKNENLLVTLGHRSVTFDLFNRNLQMSGPVSKRKDNFPMILQHDIPLTKESMGAPLFNINGKCLGINIARVDRVTVFAIPSSIANKFIQSIKN